MFILAKHYFTCMRNRILWFRTSSAKWFLILASGSNSKCYVLSFSCSGRLHVFWSQFKCVFKLLPGHIFPLSLSNMACHSFYFFEWCFRFSLCCSEWTWNKHIKSIFNLLPSVQVCSLPQNIQDGGQKKGFRVKFEILFTKWKLPFYPCMLSYISWSLIIKG